MLVASAFTAAKRQRQPKCPSRNEWINKMWSIHTMEHYSALKRKQTLTQATTWMKLEDILPRDMTQTEKDKYCIIPLI